MWLVKYTLLLGMTKCIKCAKNRLSNIIKAAEKEYFSKQLEQNESNKKTTWDIIKQVINRNKRKPIQDQFKLSNGAIAIDKNIVSNHFNDFFLIVGPQLAANISKIKTNFLRVIHKIDS